MPDETPGPSEFRLDLDAMVPVPRGSVTFKGVKYPVLSIIDVPSEVAFEILRIDETVKGQPLPEQIALMRRAAQYLVPSFTAEVLGQMTTAQLIQVALRTMGVAKAEDPPSADGSRGSSSSLPSSAASTDGP